MKARSKVLCDHSISMAISAIEIYNKPNFSNREQVFSILIIAAWETLLKAKIVKDAKNRMNSLYVKDSSGRYKKNRNKEFLTINMDEAINRIHLSGNASSNIQHLLRIRDAAIHLTAESVALPYAVYTLGAAALKNYSRLIAEWFDIKLSEYNFFILPLGFSYPFKSLTLAQVKCEPETIAQIVMDLEKERLVASNDGYYLVCEIQTSMISAKKITEDTGFTTKVDPKSEGAVIFNQKVNLIHQYPYSWTAALDKLKLSFPNIKSNEFSDFIKAKNIKSDKRYSAYNFKNKEDEAQGPTKSTPSLYNEDLINFAKQGLQLKT
jgi:hypothetical protein